MEFETIDKRKFLSHKAYAEKLVPKVGLNQVNKRSTQLDVNVILSKDVGTLLHDPKAY